MNKRWFPILLVGGLLGLLVLLAFLQYQWLGQISDGERERLKARLKTDTQRFSEDFNREIQSAYFNFQFPGDVWRDRNWSEFNERYEFWRSRTNYPELIKGFYFFDLKNSISLQYNFQNRSFEATELPENLQPLTAKLKSEKDFQSIDEGVPALVMPVYEVKEKIRDIVLKTTQTEDIKGMPVNLPDRTGALIIVLDAPTINERILADLSKKYFADGDSTSYRLAIKDRGEQIIYQTGALTSSDSSVKIFDLASNDFIFFGNRDLEPRKPGVTRSVIYSTTGRFETRTAPIEKPKPNNNTSVQLHVLTEEKLDTKPRMRIIESSLPESQGVWTLSVQHTAGSLDDFINSTRRKNLLVSFGILALLGGSILLIFISAQRAKIYAQRQVDFVSSVSHEFRTPLAVIFSASENLADGVTREPERIERYGNLIKSEGRKLSMMVEQILEFAGARSGKKKYDMRKTDVRKVIEEALNACQPLIDEKKFSVETDIAAEISTVMADRAALSQALQNLITNALKYSNGHRWLKVKAENGDGNVKITVEDHGIGISATDLKHIFEPFFRSKTVVDEQIHGNGLGLSLVKETIEAHGGRVEVTSEYGKGSKFSLQVPAIGI